MSCKLNYIPKHLHRNDRDIISEFEEKERLYLRIHPQHDTPFKTITLANLSFNRDGGSIKLCDPDDVLWNINEEDDEEKYDQGVKYFDISYKGEAKCREDPSLLLNKSGNVLQMRLSHKPLDCNYPHCDFDFILNNNIVVTKSNFKDTLGHKKFKKIRTEARLKLHSAIIQKEIVMLD